MSWLNNAFDSLQNRLDQVIDGGKEDEEEMNSTPDQGDDAMQSVSLATSADNSQPLPAVLKAAASSLPISPSTHSLLASLDPKSQNALAAVLEDWKAREGECNTSMDELSSELEQANGTLHRLREQVKQQSVEINDLSTENEKIRAVIAQKLEEQQTQQQQQQQQEQHQQEGVSDSSSNALLEEKDSKIHEMQEEIKQLHAKVEALEAASVQEVSEELSSEESQEATAAAVQVVEGHYKTQIEKLKSEHDSTISSLQQQLEEAKEHAAKVEESSESQAKDSQQQIEELKKQLEKEQQKCQNMEEELESFETQWAEEEEKKDAEIAMKEEQLTALQKQLKEQQDDATDASVGDASSDANAEMQEKVNALEESAQKLQMQLQEKEAAYEANTQKLSEQHALEVGALKSQMDALQHAQEESSKIDHDEMEQAQEQKLLEQQHTYEERIKKLEAEQQQIQAELAAKHTKDMELQISEHEQAVAILQEKMATMVSSLTDTRAQFETANEELLSKESQLQALTQQLANQNIEMEQHLQQQESTASAHHLQQELDAANKQIAELNDEVSKLQESIPVLLQEQRASNELEMQKFEESLNQQHATKLEEAKNAFEQEVAALNAQHSSALETAHSQADGDMQTKLQQMQEQMQIQMQQQMQQQFQEQLTAAVQSQVLEQRTALTQEHDENIRLLQAKHESESNQLRSELLREKEELETMLRDQLQQVNDAAQEKEVACKEQEKAERALQQEELHATVRKLNDQLELVTSDKEALALKLEQQESSSKEELGKIQEELSSSATTCNSLEAKLELLTTNEQALKTENAALQQRIVLLEESISSHEEEARQQSVSQSGDEEALREQCNDLHKELSQQKRVYASKELAMQEEFEAVVDSLRKELASRCEENEGTVAELVKLQKANKALESEVTSLMESLETSAEAQKREVEALAQSIENLEKSNAALSKERDEIKLNASTANEEWKEQLQNQWAETKSELEQANRSLSEEVQTLRSSNTSLLQRLQVEESSQADRDTQYSNQVTQAHLELEELRNQSDAQNKAFEREKDVLTERINAFEEENEDLMKQVEDLELQNNGLNAQIVELQQKTMQQNQQMEEQSIVHEKTQEHLATEIQQQKDHEQMVQQHDAALREVQTLQTNVLRLSEERQQLEATILEQSEQAGNLEQELEFVKNQLHEVLNAAPTAGTSRYNTNSSSNNNTVSSSSSINTGNIHNNSQNDAFPGKQHGDDDSVTVDMGSTKHQELPLHQEGKRSGLLDMGNASSFGANMSEGLDKVFHLLKSGKFAGIKTAMMRSPATMYIVLLHVAFILHVLYCSFA